MPVDPITASRTARAHAMRVQKIVAKRRAKQMLPNEEATADKGRAQAEQAASYLGVGDNLREALDDLYTRDQPKAAAWTSRLQRDLVTGNGDISPKHAVATVPMFAPGTTAQASATVDDPTALASLTGQLIAESGRLAAASHGSAASDNDG